MSTRKRYKALIEASGLKADLKNVSYAMRYVLITSVIIALAIVFLVTGILLFLVGDAMAFRAFITFLVLFVLYYVIKVRKDSRIATLAVDKCDTYGASVLLASILPYVGKKKDFFLNAYNLASYLFYSGKFDAMQNIIKLVDGMDDKTMMVDIENQILYCKYFFYKKDRDELQKHVKKLWDLSQNYNSPMFDGICKLCFKYPDVLLHEENGDYEKALEMYNEVQGDSNILKVRVAYHKAYVLKKLGRTSEFEEYKNYVLDNGGSTWYREYIQKI